MAPTTRQPPKKTVYSLPPEILMAIFNKVSAPQDLYHCLLVSKSWAKCCVDLLWHRPLFTDWHKLTKVAHAIQDSTAYWNYPDLVKRLNLSNLATQISDGTLAPFSVCTRIERLTLTGCVHLTDSGIIPLVQGNRSLLALDITGVHHISDATIKALANNCPRLQGLNVTGCANITDDSLVPLANSCKYLKRVSSLTRLSLLPFPFNWLTLHQSVET
jgi:F-box and leucine-rich repeat protein GRR1